MVLSFLATQPGSRQCLVAAREHGGRAGAGRPRPLPLRATKKGRNRSREEAKNKKKKRRIPKQKQSFAKADEAESVTETETELQSKIGRTKEVKAKTWTEEVYGVPAYDPSKQLQEAPLGALSLSLDVAAADTETSTPPPPAAAAAASTNELTREGGDQQEEEKKRKAAAAAAVAKRSGAGAGFSGGNSNSPSSSSLNQGQASASAEEEREGSAGSDALPSVSRGQVFSACLGTSVVFVFLAGFLQAYARSVGGPSELLEGPQALNLWGALCVLLSCGTVTCTRLGLLTLNADFLRATNRSNQQILTPLLPRTQKRTTTNNYKEEEQTLAGFAATISDFLTRDRTNDDTTNALETEQEGGSNTSTLGFGLGFGSYLSSFDLFWLCFLPGVTEEALFRGALIPATGCDDWRGIAISALIFGYFHRSGGRNWVFALWSAWVGCVYGTSFLVTKNVLVPMVAHSLSNWCAAQVWFRNQHQEKPSSSS